MTAFKDHFSAHAAAYARHRPTYPAALYAHLATLTDGHGRAWDCATGNGQAARGLAPHFAEVVATDASADQIAHAVPHDGVTYHIAPATHTPLADASADLITVAQAIHWFPFDAFYAEVRRVAKPGGLLAAWTYAQLRVSPEVEALIHTYTEEVVGAYWPPERRLVDTHYRTIPFPFDEIDGPAMEMEATWRLADLLGYLGTWSASRRFFARHGHHPIALVHDALADAWGDPDAERRVRWPLHFRLGRVQ